MNNLELEALRKILFFTVPEASKYIAGHKSSHRTWQYYESGKAEIPDDVIQKIEDLLEKRERMIGYFLSKNAAYWYRSFEQYAENFPDGTIADWRIRQAAIASVVANDENFILKEVISG